jgi:hypothetical protein
LGNSACLNAIDFTDFKRVYFIMNGMRMMKSVLSISAVMAVFTGVMTVQCCTFIQTRRVITQETKKCHDDFAALERADKAFQKKNYRKAMDYYQHLRYAGDKLVRRRALYGLAVTRLILAENADEYNDALILWNSWSRLAPTEMNDEDPRMVGPLLRSFASQMIARKKSEKASPPKEKLTVLGSAQSGQKEIRHLKERLKVLEAENLTLKRQKEMMGKEIRTLKNQIVSFEAIDQKMQEKKKEISSP